VRCYFFWMSRLMFSMEENGSNRLHALTELSPSTFYYLSQCHCAELVVSSIWPLHNSDQLRRNFVFKRAVTPGNVISCLTCFCALMRGVLKQTRLRVCELATSRDRGLMDCRVTTDKWDQIRWLSCLQQAVCWHRYNLPAIIDLCILDSRRLREYILEMLHSMAEVQLQEV
jgi:hypothetical protein